MYFRIVVTGCKFDLYMEDRQILDAVDSRILCTYVLDNVRDNDIFEYTNNQIVSGSSAKEFYRAALDSLDRNDQGWNY